jgi:hypothetical protein
VEVTNSCGDLPRLRQRSEIEEMVETRECFGYQKILGFEKSWKADDLYTRSAFHSEFYGYLLNGCFTH